MRQFFPLLQVVSFSGSINHAHFLYIVFIYFFKIYLLFFFLSLSWFFTAPPYYRFFNCKTPSLPLSQFSPLLIIIDLLIIDYYYYYYYFSIILWIDFCKQKIYYFFLSLNCLFWFGLWWCSMILILRRWTRIFVEWFWMFFFVFWFCVLVIVRLEKVEFGFCMKL